MAHKLIYEVRKHSPGTYAVVSQNFHGGNVQDYVSLHHTKRSAATRVKYLNAYYALPVTASPSEFLDGHGNWSLTEDEYHEAMRLAKKLVRR